MGHFHHICGVFTLLSVVYLAEAVYHLNSTELFHIRLDPGMFWPEMVGLVDIQEMKPRHHYPVIAKGSEHLPEIEYDASLKSMPDLPNWITQRQPKGSLHAYLYGAAPKPGLTQIDVVAFNHKNYRTLNKTITLKAADKPRKANFEVQLKLFDINVEDMLRNGYHTDLVKIFQRNLWNPQPGPEEDVYLTLLASAVDMGYRLPHNPKEKEGVIIHIGSVYPFSMKLQKIEKEVKPLLAHSPCPKDFRKTSAHHYFSRKKHFKIDWCGFRLFSRIEDSRLGSHMHSNKSPAPVNVFKDENDFFQPPVAKSHTRDLLLDFVLCIVIPAAVIIFLLIGLTFVMFCNREGIAERNKLVTGVELSQFNSIQQASHKLREMAINREQPMLALPAPSSNSSTRSLPRQSLSPNNSPKLLAPTIKLSQPNVRMGAGVRRPSSLRPPYSASSGATSRRNSTMTH